MAWGDAALAQIDPFNTGHAARLVGLHHQQNPHPIGTWSWEAWQRGWRHADAVILAKRIAALPRLSTFAKEPQCPLPTERTKTID